MSKDDGINVEKSLEYLNERHDKLLDRVDRIEEFLQAISEANAMLFRKAVDIAKKGKP